MRKLVLQKLEDAVRSPEALDDTVLLPLTDNTDRRVAAEVAPEVFSETLDAIVSQLRQILYGIFPGHWSDVPAISLLELRSLVPAPLTMACATTVAPGDLVYHSLTANNSVVTATDNLSPEPIFGLVTSKVSPTAATVIYTGIVPCPLSRGKVFVGPDGLMTLSIPTTGYMQHLGISFGNGQMLFQPEHHRTKRSP